MKKDIVAKVDRSMLEDSLDEQNEKTDQPKLKVPFENHFDLEVYDYSASELNLFFLKETIHYRNVVLLLALKKYNEYPNQFRAELVRLHSLVQELKKYGQVQLINTVNGLDGFDMANMIVHHPTDPLKDIYVLISELAYEEAHKYPEYKDDVIDGHIVYAEGIQIYAHPANQDVFGLVYDIEKNASIEISDTEVYIEMIIQTQQGLSTQKIKFQSPPKSDLDLHYRKGFTQFHEKLVERISTRDKGVVMFHGPPGNGKTHYIRRLLPELSKHDKRVILIPKHILESLESPAFNTFMLQHFVGQKIVFIMEDAESIVTKRAVDGGGRSQLVSTLLNITDGILNDIFSIQVILTFNTALTSIDEALLRDGRLIAKYEFKPLPREQAEELVAHLGLNPDDLPGNKSEFSLAEIYALRESEDDQLLIKQNFATKKEPVGF